MRESSLVLPHPESHTMLLTLAILLTLLVLAFAQTLIQFAAIGFAALALMAAFLFVIESL